MQICAVQQLGLVPYDDACLLQIRLAGEIANGQRPPTLLLVEHPHVFTLGRQAASQHLLWDAPTLAQRKVAVRSTDRGGDITYHGPGQLVGYPLLPLAPSGWQSGHLPQADFIGYLRKLEAVLIQALAQFGVTAVARPGLTGVWIPPQGLLGAWMGSQPAKIASIGVKIDTRGVSHHGFALNVQPDMDYWQGIIPCGLDDVKMISLAQLGQPIAAMEQVIAEVISAFGLVFHYKMVVE